MTELYIQVDEDQADRIFVDLLLKCYYEYMNDLFFAENSEEITNACKVLLRQHMVLSAYNEEFAYD